MGRQLALTPEDLDVANAYITYVSIEETARQLGLQESVVSAVLERDEVRRYIDSMYLDRGYRNRSKLGDLLDTLIEKKLEEAEDSEMWTKADLLELLQFAHKMRMDELKLMKDSPTGPTVNIANFGEGNYGQLMEKLLNGGNKQRV